MNSRLLKVALVGLLTLLAVAIAPALAGAAITVGNVTTGSADTSSLTVPHNHDQGTAGLIVVSVTGVSSGYAVTNVTYGGNPLTRLCSVAHPVSKPRVEIWYRASPSTGTQNVVVTFSGGAEKVGVGIVSYGGVDQTTPVQNCATATGLSATPSVNVVSASGDLVQDSVGHLSTFPLSPQAGQTERWDYSPAGDGRHGGSTEAGACTVTMSWTIGESKEWAIAGFNIKAADAAPVLALGASVKSVQTGSVNMTATTWTVPITTVDPNKSFVVCSERFLTGKPDRLATCELAASSLTITNNHIDTGAIQWHVVEFEGGVSVQRNLESFASGDLTRNVTLTPAVTLSKSFVLITARTTETAEDLDERWTVRARLTSTTNLELSRNESGAPLSVAWQVVQMEGASVQRGLTTIANGSPSNTATISAVDTASSFLVMSRRGAANVEGVESRYRVTGELTNATTLTFTRATPTDDVDVAWEVVALSEGSCVQHGTAATVSTSDATLDATLTAIDTSRSVPIFTTATTQATDSKKLDDTSWTAVFTSTTNLRLQRTAATVDGAVAWFVVQFFKCPPVADAGYAPPHARSGQVTLYWSSATPVLILRKTSAFTTEAPGNGQAYAVNDPIGAATVVYNGSVAETSFTQTGLTDDTTYYYKVVPKGAGAPTCYAAGTALSTTPRPGPTPAWSYTLAGGSMLKAGIAGSGTIYTASNASRIVSLATADGTQSWTPVATSGAVQGALTWVPLSDGGSAVIGGDQTGRLYLVDPAAGTATWSLPQTGADAIQASTAAQLRSFSNAAFKAVYTTDVLFAATRNASSTNNRLFAIRASDGAVLWTFNGTGAASVDYAAGMPYVDYARNRIYLVTRAGASGTQNSLWVLDSLNGAVLAAFNVGHVEISPTLSYDGATLYVANTAGDLYALNTTTLAMKWSSPSALGAAVKGYVWEDWFTTGRLYFSTADGFAWCLQDPGAGSPPNPASPVWKTGVAGPAAPLVLDAVFVGSSDGKIHQLNMTTGVGQKQFTVGDGASTVGDLSTEDGTQVFAGTTAGKLYKIPLPLP